MQRSVLNTTIEQTKDILPPLAEVLTKYQPGELTDRPRWIAGRAKNLTEANLLKIGMFMVHALSAIAPAVGDEGYAAAFERCQPGSKPVGRIEYLQGDIVIMRRLEGDIEIAGVTAGSEYVVGTDYLHAKSGDSNYPTGVSNPFVIGVGWTPNRLMLGTSNAAGGTGKLSGQITTISSTVLANSRTDFDQTISDLDLSKLAVGKKLRIFGLMSLVTAAAGTTVTFYLKAEQTGAAADVDIFLPAPIDPVDAGDVAWFEVFIYKASATQIQTWGQIVCKGDVTGKQSSGGGLAVPTTLDMSVTTKLIPALSFSAAGANAGILRMFEVGPA